jgi:hypothetical protein
MRERGMVLLSALLFLVVMLLVVASNLVLSQLSLKYAGLTLLSRYLCGLVRCCSTVRFDVNRNQ